jgi:hypothetical protein
MQSSELLASIVAERIVDRIEAAGYVVMQGPPANLRSPTRTHELGATVAEERLGVGLRASQRASWRFLTGRAA